MLKRICLYCLLCLLTALPLAAQEDGFNDGIDRNDPNFVKASLVIAEPGEVLYSVLGHAFFRMECPTFGLDYCFSYESESVQDKVLTFLLGKLKMGMICASTDEMLEPFIKEGRGVTEYELNLPPKVKQNLWRVLDEKVAEGIELPYDFIKRGCAISCMHILHEALDTIPVEYAPWGKECEKTRKDIWFENSRPFPWAGFWGMTLCAGSTEWECPNEEKLIKPLDLLHAWQNATVQGKPLASKQGKVLTEHTKTPSKSFITPLAISLIILVLSILTWLAQIWNEYKAVRITADVITYILLTLQTLFGLFITYLVCFSHLPATEWNWLIIPFNPLPAILWHWRKYWSLPWAIVMIIWMVAMLLAPHRLVEPAHIVLVLAWTLILLKNTKWTEKINILTHKKSTK